MLSPSLVKRTDLNAVDCFAFDAVGVLVLGQVIFKKYLFFFKYMDLD